MAFIQQQGWTKQVVEDVSILQQGTQLATIEPNGERKNWRVWLTKSTTRVLFSSQDSGEQYDKSIEIMDIFEIRCGCRTDELLEIRDLVNQTNENELNEFEECSFSVHQGVEGQIIHSFLAPDPICRARWIKVLSMLVTQYEEAIRQSRCDPKYWLNRVFREADKNNSGLLTLDECKYLLAEQLNVVLDDNLVEKYFEAANTNKEGMNQLGLDEKEFYRFFQLVSQRPALDELFNDLIGEDKTLSVEKLFVFLTETQGEEGLDLDQVRNMIVTYEGIQFEEDSEVKMTLTGFRSMMVSDMFDIRLEKHRRINQPMDRPLSHYWLKSSHNTYLTANQLVGKSSIEGFRRALARNCACIELDLHNGANKKAIIKHGHTLTTPILASRALEHGILPFIFTHDDYPVFLSMEDHLTESQRRVFIRDFYEIMKDHIYLVNEDELDSLPSPEQLKGKVIIKASKKNWHELANICQSVHFPENALDGDAPRQPFYHVSSLSEYRIDQLLKPTLWEQFNESDSADFRLRNMKEHTTRQLIRVYPGAHRQLSGNYNPIPAMNAGCQMAAMNVQTKCSNLAIYEGRFRSNGDCAYVLKPDILIDPSCVGLPSKRVIIKIISGQNLTYGHSPGSVFNPYVNVRIDGDPDNRNKQSTKKVNGNGLNPVWNTEMVFDVAVPELAIILFEVKHSDCCLTPSKTFGSFALPVLSLASGFRHVPLQDHHLLRVPLATLYVQVTIQDIPISPHEDDTCYYSEDDFDFEI